MKYFRIILLYPFSLIYSAVTLLRNLLFDFKFKKIYISPQVVISVGNISTGGTGKTPMIEYLLDLLNNKYFIISILSRGYKRKTKGLVIADHQSNAMQIGDEPYQYYQKYYPKSNILVSEKRAIGLEYLDTKTNNQIVLLDDAYQHRYVSRDLNILLTSIDQPFWDDYVLPSGNLRENRNSAQRADCIIVTKCDFKIKKKKIKANIYKYCKKSIPIYFSNISYQDGINILDKKIKTKNVIGFAGLADNKKFENYLKENFQLLDFVNYKDHYHFSENDIIDIIAKFQLFVKTYPDLSIVTTEKDFSRLKFIIKDYDILEKNLFYVPIKVVFIDKEKEFIQLVLANTKK